jgi:D-3-phosphoglycerate dehydrogenase
VKPRLVIVGQAVQSSEVIEKCTQFFDVSQLANIEDFGKLDPPIVTQYSLWVHFDTRLTSDVFKNHNMPEFLLTTTTGLTHISKEILESLENRILHLASERDFLKSITATAEHAWSLLMAMTMPWLQYPHQHHLARREDLIRDFQLASRHIGIIGYGRLGRMMSNYALAFGMQVHVFDSNPSVKVPLGSGVIQEEKIENLVEVCDIISLHASAMYPCTEVLSKEILDQCKFGVLIINSARGCLVDEKYIAEQIETGAIGFYATDVLREEEVGFERTPSSLKLRAQSRDRVIITPHIGGANTEAMNLCESNLLSRLISRIQPSL